MLVKFILIVDVVKEVEADALMAEFQKTIKKFHTSIQGGYLKEIIPEKDAIWQNEDNESLDTEILDDNEEISNIGFGG